MIPDFPSMVQVNLRWGQPRTIGELAETMAVSRRAVEQAIETLRLTGSPVVTGSAGVWLSTDSKELHAAAKSLQSRAVTILVGARALRATARRYEKVQQAVLWSEVA